MAPITRSVGVGVAVAVAVGAAVTVGVGAAVTVDAGVVVTVGALVDALVGGATAVGQGMACSPVSAVASGIARGTFVARSALRCPSMVVTLRFMEDT
jgi:hypothetical protein